MLNVHRVNLYGLVDFAAAYTIRDYALYTGLRHSFGKTLIYDMVCQHLRFSVIWIDFLLIKILKGCKQAGLYIFSFTTIV